MFTNDIHIVQDVFDHLPCNIFWKDKDGQYKWCNTRTALILGLKSSEDIKGKFNSDILPKNLANIADRTDEIVIKTKKEYRTEELGKDINGNAAVYLATKTPIFSKSGKLAGLLGVALDITELKKAQKTAEVASQAKTEFLENMRHDIRTPLSGIVGCAQLIQMQANNPKKVAEYADDLVQSSDALLELLNKVLESIQVASGEIPLLKKRFNLCQALEQIVQLNKPQSKIKNLNLQLDYDKTIPVYLLGDPVRVQRIILELLTNALKFTDKGEIKVVARLMKTKTQSGQIIVKLSVHDTGIGIPLNQQNEVYTRFKRLTPSYQGIYPGTGLGLSVVKQFIDDLDGEIQLDSKINQGSTFTCLIPFQKSLSTENGDEVEEIPAFAMDICLADKKVAKAVPYTRNRQNNRKSCAFGGR